AYGDVRARARDGRAAPGHAGGMAHDGGMTTMLPPWPERPLVGERVALRRADARDAPMARSLSADPYVPAIGSLPPEATDEQARAWIARQRDSRDRGAGFSFTIVDRRADAAVGNCGLWLRELAEGRASAGYAIAPEHRRAGLAADALRTLTAFAAAVPGLHRVELYIEPWNTGSLRTADAAGFTREGLLHSHQWIGGERRDMVLCARILH
ncbi:MAG TPA: GNAT family protein, partial [Brevibacterium sp.]|nr:GNAT family protein [Brevibacterium sp.]